MPKSVRFTDKDKSDSLCGMKGADMSMISGVEGASQAAPREAQPPAPAQVRPVPAAISAKPGGGSGEAQPQPQTSSRDSSAAAKAAAETANKLMREIDSSLRFSTDDSTGKTVVQMIDSQTNEVIRQFPSEKMLEIAKSIDQMKGLLVSKKA